MNFIYDVLKAKEKNIYWF